MGAAPAAEAYVELDVKTNFSFLRGASHPDELVYRAAELGYRAIAITDLNTLAGVVRAHEAAKETGLKLLIGSHLTFDDGPDLLVYASDRPAYARLCRLLTLGKRRAEKGECLLHLADFLEHQEGVVAAALPDSCLAAPLAGRGPDAPAARSSRAPQAERLNDANYRALGTLRDCLGDRFSLAVSCLYGVDDITRMRDLLRLGRRLNIPLLATNAAHYHDPSRRALQDVLTCIRHGCTIQEAGFRLFPNGERYLKSPAQMHRLFAEHPGALARGIEIAERCNFSLDELRYEYPDELAPPGNSPLQYLSQLAWDGARERYPAGVPDKVRQQIEHELKLIAQLKFEAYFLTVYDLVKFARSRGILCQGRGSAANSAVCYCIGVTSVDPSRIDVLFERFISSARNEPPDIDVDFEHERREEVIQYIYEKYGRDRAGMTAEVISYRGRSAVRDVGKALGLSLDLVDSMAKRLDWWDRGTLSEDRIRESGLDPADRTVRLIIALTSELLGFPRHLSQHVGGMVMTRTPLCEIVPIENASMEDRTVIEWDKDDIDALGILKVDVLALGMLTCISKAFGFINGGEGKRHEGTEARRHEGEEGTHEHEQYSNSSGSDSLAVGDEAGKRNLSSDAGDAQTGVVWADKPDAAGGNFHSVQYRRGIWARNDKRLPEAPENLPRLDLGIIDSIRIGDHVGNAFDEQTTLGPPGGSRPRPPRPHSQHPTAQIQNDVSEEGTEASPPSCLRASVPPCLALQLHTVPPEDSAVYDMICDADTIGVFQIESRAQMSMLPRLRPRCFYDLVIEVAIVRPGPIQGNMVHPYLRRRNGEEAVNFPSEALRQVLQKTLGVPLFQEQAMRVAMVGANFSAEEADRLRRAMASWRKSGVIEGFHQKIIDGMLANGYTREFAEQSFLQIRGFGEYGFPESHSASFALLVYVSAWIKRHHPAGFCAALLNSQPMGFYAPAQIVRDARDHGVNVLPIDINHSDWDCTLENRRGGVSPPSSKTPAKLKSTWGLHGPAVRLGFRQVRGLRQADAERIAEVRKPFGIFTSIEQFHRVTALPRHVLECLAEADAFRSLNLPRREALWQVMALTDEDLPLFDEATVGCDSSQHENKGCNTLHPTVASIADAARSFGVPQDDISPRFSDSPIPFPLLPPMSLSQEVMTDYSKIGLSLKAHPLSLVRQTLAKMKLITAAQLQQLPQGRWVKIAGLVLVRQRPGTASGVVFATIEDETGAANLVIWSNIYDRFRGAARHATLLQADGYVERQGQVVHVMAKRLFDLSHLLREYNLRSRDFH
jgi:error-prone DNA polymerase